MCAIEMLCCQFYDCEGVETIVALQVGGGGRERLDNVFDVHLGAWDSGHANRR